MAERLTVFCVLWGDRYPVSYVTRLARMVRKNLTVDHDFVCITDAHIPGVKCVKPIVSWPGWWQKVSLFGVDSGPWVYLDLDTLIVGNIDGLAKDALKMDLGMPRQFRPGGLGWQSSVMVSNGNFSMPFDAFEPERLGRVNCQHFGAYGFQRLYGDQDYLSILFRRNITTLHSSRGILSYKYACKNRLPSGARVVTFHGKPDYDEVKTFWVRRVLEQYE